MVAGRTSPRPALNLILSFVHPTKPPRSIGPFSLIRLDTESLLDASDNVLARHRNHVWQVGAERYFRLDATARVRIHFERGRHDAREMSRSRDFGPFDRFSAVDGITYTDDRVFAFADAKFGDWFCYDDGRHWAVMVVIDASGGAAKSPLGSAALLAPLVAGVIALWEGGKLLYLGSARSIRARLEALVAEKTLDSSGVTAVTWEAHANPALRETELHSEYASGSKNLLDTYGQLQGSLARTFRLVAEATRRVARARAIRDDARRLRARRRAAA
jgi:hypothetical protein